MARYIDVEPLGDKLKEHIKTTESELMLGALSTFLRLLDITPTADVAPRWIPCEERLPEEYGCYLITTNDGSVDLALFGDTKDEKAWSSCDANGFYWLPLRGIEVVAWMPLPEPYKGERKDDE